MSSAHFCRACGRRWLDAHKPGCVMRRSYAANFVTEQDCINPRFTVGGLCEPDNRARTAPHGDKAAA